MALNSTLTYVNSRGILMSMLEVQESIHTSADLITAGPLLVEDSVTAYPMCTQDENTFALAVIESSGNIAAAYRIAFGGDERFPLARGKEMLSRPQVALKIRDITDKIQDASLISVGAHLHELAEIRDLAKGTGQLKTALAAERARGEAVGIYQKHDAANRGRDSGQVNIQINMASRHDVNI